MVVYVAIRRNHLYCFPLIGKYRKKNSWRHICSSSVKGLAEPVFREKGILKIGKEVPDFFSTYRAY